MNVVTDTPATLDVWEARCRAHGLSITPSRRAILAAMLQRAATCDAVEWLLAAQTHHPATSINTVYRFLREMEQRGLAEAVAKPHARCRWRLRDASPTEVDDMLRQVEAFLHEMEVLGLAQARSAKDASPTGPVVPG